MRNEYLSDHGGDLLRSAQQARMDAAAELQACEDRLTLAEARLQAVRDDRSWWRRLLSRRTAAGTAAVEQVDEANWQLRRAERRWQRTKPDVERQAAGVRGEVKLVAGLASLSDEWVALRGYRNRRGETDVVLIGPLGIWAIEVKNYGNARVHIDGEQWSYDRLDDEGEIRQTYPAVDGSGRSWARQVIDVADDLTAWLSRNGHRVSIGTAVMLVNDGAQLGRCRDPEVDFIGTDPRRLLEVVAERSTPIDPGDCKSIVELIRRDHRHHER